MIKVRESPQPTLPGGDAFLPIYSNWKSDSNKISVITLPFIFSVKANRACDEAPTCWISFHVEVEGSAGDPRCSWLRGESLIPEPRMDVLYTKHIPSLCLFSCKNSPPLHPTRKYQACQRGLCFQTLEGIQDVKSTKTSIFLLHLLTKIFNRNDHV